MLLFGAFGQFFLDTLYTNSGYLISEKSENTTYRSTASETNHCPN